MSRQTAAKLPSGEIILTVLNGPEAGVGYKLLGQSITLGRAPENDVVLQDGKSSRNHARIERRGNDYWIKDLESTAGIIVNGKVVRESVLKPGDEITVGATALRFGASAGPSLMAAAPPVPQNIPPLPHLPLTKNANLEPPPPIMPSPAMPMPGAPAAARPSRPRYGNAKETNFLPFIIIAVLVIGAMAMWKGHSKRRAGFQVKDESVYEQQIEATSQSNDQRAQEIARTGKDTQQYSEAQAFYMRGFREFREGNYNRAIQGFQAALSIYPNHPLAKRYLETARIKNNQLVTEALERGEKDFQLQKYNMAKNEFRSVMLLSSDRNNKSFQLAEKRLETIELILQSNK